MEIIINESLAKKVIAVVDYGLSNGVGVPEPGKMCIEAAVNYACGLPHGDNPSCVGGAVRRFKIELNDANWSSDEARAKGMREIAIAQLGSNTLNQIEFGQRMAIKNTKILLPILMRKVGLEEVAKKCESVNTIPETIDAAKCAAEYAEYPAKSAAEYAAKSAECAAEYAEYPAKSAKYAAEYAKYAAEYDPDFFFKLSAQICLQVLIEMKSPGCEFLYVTK